MFLQEYPFCYVYWEKYASFENNFGFPDRSLNIYQRAIKEVRYSVDIWIYYLNYLLEHNEKDSTIRS